MRRVLRVCVADAQRKLYAQNPSNVHFLIVARLASGLHDKLCKLLDWYFHRTQVIPDDQTTVLKYWRTVSP